MENVVPRCCHFGQCGGCRLQDVPYQSQLELKESQIKTCFKDLIHQDVEFRPIIPAPDHWEYRNKMEFSFSQDKKGQKFLGLFMRNARGRVVSLEECYLVPSWYLLVLQTVMKWWQESDIAAYHFRKNSGSLRTLTIREGKRTHEKMIMLTISGNPNDQLSKENIDRLIEMIEELEGVSSLYLRKQMIQKGVPTYFEQVLLSGKKVIQEHLFYDKHTKERKSLIFNVSPQSFFQPNTVQAERIYDEAITLLNLDKHSVVYDLYSGTGTLSIYASKKAATVIGIECSKEACQDAKINATNNECQNVSFFHGTVADVLPKIMDSKEFPHPHCIIIDPPRAGIDRETIEMLLQMQPDKIMSISCKPQTQALDLTHLIEGGYTLKTIQPIDQFPQTYHVENLCLLERCLK